jgi:hypothetical protein
MKYFLVLIVLVFAQAASGQEPPKNAIRTFFAASYYVVARGQNWSPYGDLVRFNGASNLPAGANILVTVADFDHDAWKDYSDAVCVPVAKNGFFSGEIHPKLGMKFHTNLILRASFATNVCKQSASVLRIVGPKGEHLGEKDAPFGELVGVSRNPQLYQASGWYYGLETIARIE